VSGGTTSATYPAKAPDRLLIATWNVASVGHPGEPRTDDDLVRALDGRLVVGACGRIASLGRVA
jgi:hypothetical protein